MRSNPKRLLCAAPSSSSAFLCLAPANNPRSLLFSPKKGTICSSGSAREAPHDQKLSCLCCTHTCAQRPLILWSSALDPFRIRSGVDVAIASLVSLHGGATSVTPHQPRCLYTLTLAVILQSWPRSKCPSGRPNHGVERLFCSLRAFGCSCGAHKGRIADLSSLRRRAVVSSQCHDCSLQMVRSPPF